MSGNNGLVVEADSVLISDLLYFVYNKLKSTDVKKVVSICHAFYTDNDIVFKEKKKLCEVTGEPCTLRRTDDKRMKNIEDICQIMYKRDAAGDILPKMASLNMNNVPITDEGEPSLGQILATLNLLKKSTVTRDHLSQSLNSLREEMKAPIVTSPAPVSAPPPPPVSPSHSVAPSWGAPSEIINASAPNESIVAEAAESMSSSAAETVNRRPLMNQIIKDTSNSATQPPGGGGSRRAGGGGGREGGGGGGGAGARERSQMRGGAGRGGGGGDNQRRRNAQDDSRPSSRPKTIIGQKVKDGILSFKGADLTINKYIGRVHNDVTQEELRQYIVDAGISVVELETLETKHKRFQSFRLRVKRTDLDRIEQPDLWPEGVIVSPFFRPKSKAEQSTTSGNAAASLHT